MNWKQIRNEEKETSFPFWSTNQANELSFGFRWFVGSFVVFHFCLCFVFVWQVSETVKSPLASQLRQELAAWNENQINISLLLDRLTNVTSTNEALRRDLLSLRSRLVVSFIFSSENLVSSSYSRKLSVQYPIPSIPRIFSTWWIINHLGVYEWTQLRKEDKTKSDQIKTSIKTGCLGRPAGITGSFYSWFD